MPWLFSFAPFLSHVFLTVEREFEAQQTAVTSCLCIRVDETEEMAPTIKTDLERQQSTMLEKLSSIMDNKLESMKRQLEDVSSTQMSAWRRYALANLILSRRKDMNNNTSITSRWSPRWTKQKMPLQREITMHALLNSTKALNLLTSVKIGDKSEYGWKTVGEYLDRGLTDNDQDANKMKTTEKEAQKKIAETHPAKAAKARPWYKPLRPLGITAINLPSYSLYWQEVTRLAFPYPWAAQGTY